MKNTVDEIIRAFSKEELREFKYFITRRNDGKTSRLDTKVVQEIRNNVAVQDDRISTHRQTKNRLKWHLEQFIQMENIRNNSVSRINNLIEVAGYLFKKNIYEHAWDYLIKAEKLAIQTDEYELLNHIYYIQLSYTYNIAVPPPKNIDVSRLIEKWKTNLTYFQTDSSSNAAYAELIYKIREKFSQNLSANVDELITRILKEYNLDDEVYVEQLKIYLKTTNMVCRVLREKRDYKTLKNYSISCFQNIRNRNMLSKAPVIPLMDLLDVICISSLRSKDYVNYEKYQRLYTAYTRKMKQHPDEFSYYDFIPSIDAGDLYMYTNRLPQAKKVLTELYKKYKTYTEITRIYFLLRVNLMTLYFNYNDYDNCIRLYNEIIQFGEKKILAEPGFRLDLMLYTDLYAIIFYYETDDKEYALHLLNKVKRKYSDVINDAKAQHENLFLAILEKLIKKPDYLKGARFKNDCIKCIRMKDFIAGDNEYISINAWLTSKLKREDYYTSFLGIVFDRSV